MDNSLETLKGFLSLILIFLLNPNMFFKLVLRSELAVLNKKKKKEKVGTTQHCS
jgi:hypothetical protein